jgi:hypothetical protein
VPKLTRNRLIALAVIVVVVVAAVVIILTSSSTPTTSSTSIVVAAGDCSQAQVKFSPPGAPAVTPDATYVGITLTNTKQSCKFSKAIQSEETNPKTKTTTPVYGYGLVYAEGWSNGHAVGPISTLRGTAGSIDLSLRPGPGPAAEFTFGVSSTSKIKGCDPQQVSDIALSLDGVNFSPVNFAATPYFKQGLKVCTGTVSNLNTSPVSVIPLTPTKSTTTTKPKHS